MICSLLYAVPLAEDNELMETSSMIKEAIQKEGLGTLKAASKAIGISPELLRVILYKNHIPKDKTLIKIAEKLHLDMTALVLAAHQQQLPADARNFFLSPAPSNFYGKRIYPLSEEQCNYLREIMSAEEIQMIRKYRQVTGEGQTQIQGYIDYIFQTKRIIRNSAGNLALTG